MIAVAAVVRAVLRELEPAERWAVGGVVLRCKRRPDADDLGRGCEPDQRAAYWGRARDVAAGIETADGEITLFLDNLAPVTAERLRIALLHELGHALGLDEGTVRALGLTLDEETHACG